MEVVDGNNRDFQMLEPGHGYHRTATKTRVCYYWQSGNCSRSPCPYLHNESTQTKLCRVWSQGKKCKYGESCRYLHSWSTGGCFSLIAQLEGHHKAVTGIALSSSGSDYNLFTVSKDQTARVWDCPSGGQCKGVINLGGELASVITEGPWVFIGLQNSVKAWNVETASEQTLISDEPVGQVYALVVGNTFLFAGTQEGTILAWKANNNNNCFEAAATLTGHDSGVVSLVVGGSNNCRMYSGSVDCTIRVWCLETLRCLQTVKGHTSAVMSLLWWDRFLISCSLDKTIKVWSGGVDECGGRMEVAYTHSEEHGVVTICGMCDLEGKKPVLLCSCNDNSVRVYDLPSFSERGRMFSRQEVRSIRVGPGGVVFTGDGAGQVRVWRMVAAEATATAQQP